MFILSSISSGFKFWSVNDTSIYVNSESKVSKNIKFLDDLFGTDVCKTLEFCW